MNRFNSLVDTILNDFYASHPSEARWIGLHQYDGLVADNSQTGSTARLARITQQQAELEALPADELTDDERFDRDLLLTQLRLENFQIDELRERARNPIAWSDDIDVSGYLMRSYAPIDQRATALKQHAAAIPTVLTDASNVLERNIARPVLETAIDVFKGVASFLRDDVPLALSEAGATVSVETELAQALDAVNSFVSELEVRLATGKCRFRDRCRSPAETGVLR